MKISNLLVTGLIAFFANSACAEDITQKYCLIDAMEAASGGEEMALGNMEMTVALKQKGTKFFVSFSSLWPDSQQIVEVSEAPAKQTSKDYYAFHFTDNWDNRGKGTLRVKGNEADLSVNVIKPTADLWGKNASRQYGDYTLTKSGCNTASK